MKLQEKNGVKYFTFDKLSELRHCFSTRVGGVSSGCYDSLNLAFREDKRENVVENYNRICKAIGVDSENTVWTRQVHTANVLRVDESDRGKGLFTERQQDGYDAVITNCKDVVLTGFSADCALIFFYDKENQAVGIAHSGWRGTVLEMGAVTVKAMEREFGTRAESLICGIAPAIAKCCFQVDAPVRDEFVQKLAWSERYITVDNENEGKFYIDLHSINEEILVNAGVKRENIENSRICTRCHPELFYSHRLMGNERGSLAGMISL
jgi:hypothetical protein